MFALSPISFVGARSNRLHHWPFRPRASRSGNGLGLARSALRANNIRAFHLLNMRSASCNAVRVDYLEVIRKPVWCGSLDALIEGGRERLVTPVRRDHPNAPRYLRARCEVRLYAVRMRQGQIGAVVSGSTADVIGTAADGRSTNE